MFLTRRICLLPPLLNERSRLSPLLARERLVSRETAQCPSRIRHKSTTLSRSHFDVALASEQDNPAFTVQTPVFTLPAYSPMSMVVTDSTNDGKMDAKLIDGKSIAK